MTSGLAMARSRLSPSYLSRLAAESVVICDVGTLSYVCLLFLEISIDPSTGQSIEDAGQIISERLVLNRSSRSGI